MPRPEWIIAPSPQMLEAAIAPELFIDDIGAIEFFAGNIRLYLATHQLPLEAGNKPPLELVAAKITMPLVAVPSLIGKLARCCSPMEVSATPLFSRPHIVK